MFITKKALQRRIEEGIAKERERVEMKNWIDCRIQDTLNEFNWLRQNIDKRLWELESRICKLEDHPAKEVRKDETD